MKLFKLVEIVDNEKYFIKVFESSFYNLDVVRDKEFDYKRFEISSNRSSRFIPQMYISNSDDGFEIEIQTTSYGSLNENDFSNFVEVHQKVLGYIEEVKSIIENE